MEQQAPGAEDLVQAAAPEVIQTVEFKSVMEGASGVAPIDGAALSGGISSDFPSAHVTNRGFDLKMSGAEFPPVLQVADSRLAAGSPRDVLRERHESAVRPGDQRFQAVNPEEAHRFLRGTGAKLPPVALAMREKGSEILRKQDEAERARPQIYVSTRKGDSSFPLGSVQNPYTSIQSAVDAARDGSVINVRRVGSDVFRENVLIRRSNIVLKSDENNRAVIDGGSIRVGSGVHNVGIKYFEIKNFSGREAAIRVDGQNIREITIGGNDIHDARNAEAISVYGRGTTQDSAIKNVGVFANTISSLRLKGQIESGPIFNGNVDGFIARGNIGHSNHNLFIDAIGGEGTSTNRALDQARNGIIEFNYAHGVSTRANPDYKFAATAAAYYSDGAANIKIRFNYGNGDFFAEAGKERKGPASSGIEIYGNVSDTTSSNWLVTGSPTGNGRVSGTVHGNAVIGNSSHEAQSGSQVHVSHNRVFGSVTAVTALPVEIAQLMKSNGSQRQPVPRAGEPAPSSLPLPKLEPVQVVRRTTEVPAAASAPRVVATISSWQTVYQPVRAEGGDKGSTPPGGGRPVHLPDHTLQKFLANPVQAGYAAAAGDPRTEHGKYGTMFRIAEMNTDRFFQSMTGMSRDAWLTKWGNAYKAKHGFDLTGVHFRIVDTGSAIKGSGRVDLCVDPGSKSRPEIEAYNSPHVKHGFTMEVIDRRLDGGNAKRPTAGASGQEVPAPAATRLKETPRREVPLPTVAPQRDTPREPVPAATATHGKETAVIEDPKASFKQKAAAFAELYSRGEKGADGRVRVQLKDGGRAQEFVLERVDLGKGVQLMHVFAADADGKQHPVLRWVNRQGTIEQQKNGTGKVDYHGSWWGSHRNASNVAQYAERSGSPSPRPPVVSAPEVPPVRTLVVPAPERPPVRTPEVVIPRVRAGQPLPLDAVTDPRILNDVGRRPNGQKVEPTYIGYRGTITYADAQGRRQVQGDQPLWLDKPAAQALILANEMLKEKGKRVVLASEGTMGNQNSAGRTHTQQRIARGMAAAPGRSWHEKGSALDVRNHADPDVRRALAAVGFVGKNIPGDEWHYQFEQTHKAAGLWRQYGARIASAISQSRLVAGR